MCRGCSGGFDGQEPDLGFKAAAGREAARFAVGGQDAVAGDDQGEGILTEGLADVAGGGPGGLTQARGDFAVGQG